MRKRAGWAVIACVAVVLGVGCGGTSTTTTVVQTVVQKSARYTASDVIDRFREQTGRRLVRRWAASSSSWDALERDGDLDPDWGAWAIYVLKDGAGVEQIPLLLTGEEGVLPKPDADGIYWLRTDLGGGTDPFWAVGRLYGENVLLHWIGGETRQASLDDSFDRVDTALRALEN